MSFSTEVLSAALDRAGLLVGSRGAVPESAESITDDSRRVTRGALFLAVRGAHFDGHDFLSDVERAGASFAVVEDESRTALPCIIVRNSRQAAAVASSAAFGWPARSLRVAAVTGTNGKTTSVHILRHLLDDFGGTAASIGTIGVLLGSEGEQIAGGEGLTTPGPVELQRVFRELVDRGVVSVAMEVSSHALAQQRVGGLEADVVIYTSFSRDHLDYHRTMDRYFEAKAQLCEHLKPHGMVVVNADEPAWSELRTDRRRVGFSARLDSAEVHARDVDIGAHGSRWTLSVGGEEHEVRLPLLGGFNVSNALGAAAAAWALGMDGERIAERLSNVPQVPGRLERILDDPLVLRDYAHTPDALARALDAVRAIAPRRVIAVFGCGGDRDRGKRPEMGSIAAERADVSIVTSDNPRSEDPECIIDEIVAGMPEDKFERIEDRRAAIARAISLAGKGDLVLLAGKGHETYQVRGEERISFDEREIVRDISRGESLTR